MSVRYLQSGQGDDVPLLTVDDESGEGFWAGAQRCFAGIALTAALTASAFAAQAALRVQQDPEEAPAGSWLKFSTPDEDFWSPYAGASGDGQPAISQVLQSSVAVYQRLPYLPELSDDPAHTLAVFSTPDEDFWRNPTPPVPPPSYQARPYLPDLSDDPAHTLAVFSVPDEDFWQNPTPPVPPPNYRAQPYLPEPEELPAGALVQFSTPDEDFWTNPAQAVGRMWQVAGRANPTYDLPPTAYQPLPYLRDPEEIPAGSLYGAPEEFYWQNPIAPVPPTLFERLPYAPDPEELPAGLLAMLSTAEEDFWPPCAGASGGGQPYIVQLLQTSLALYQPLPIAAGEPAEVPPQAVFQPDEDFWVNPVAPVPATVYQRLPYLPELSDEPTASLARFSTPDEDFWPPCAGASGGGQPYIVQLLQTSLVLYQPLPIAAGESAEIPAQAVFQPDEDFWVNPVAPVPATFYQRLPYLPEPTDDPAGSLRRQPEEDFWTNPVAPAPSVVYQRLPYLPEVSDDPAGSLTKVSTPDEDYWQAMPGMPQAAWGIAPTYALRPATCQLWTDQADVPPRVFCPEDDAWGNPAQAVCRMSQVAGGVNPTYGLAPAIYQPLPVWETEPFASYWSMSRWAMRTHSIARARVSHSLARARESHSAARARASRGASRQS